MKPVAYAMMDVDGHIWWDEWIFVREDDAIKYMKQYVALEPTSVAKTYGSLKVVPLFVQG